MQEKCCVTLETVQERLQEVCKFLFDGLGEEEYSGAFFKQKNQQGFL